MKRGLTSRCAFCFNPTLTPTTGKLAKLAKYPKDSLLFIQPRKAKPHTIPNPGNKSLSFSTAA